MSRTSGSPPAWVGYLHDGKGGEETFMYEGEYPDDPVVEPENCVGVQFEMDNIQFEIVGDLAGHVAYRRTESPAVYTLRWSDFEQRVREDVIEVDK